MSFFNNTAAGGGRTDTEGHNDWRRRRGGGGENIDSLQTSKSIFTRSLSKNMDRTGPRPLVAEALLRSVGAQRVA